MFEKLKLPIITSKDLENELKIALFNYLNVSRRQAILDRSSELFGPIPNKILDNIDLSMLLIDDVLIDDKGHVFYTENEGEIY